MFMERRFYGRYGIYAPLLLFITLIATTLRTVAVFLGVNAYGFFEADALSRISAWVVVAGVLLALTYPLTHRKVRVIFRDDRTPLTYLPAAVLCVGMIFFGAEVVPEALLLLRLYHVDALSVTAAILLALAACGALYAAAVCLIEPSLSDRRAGLGMLTVLLYGVYAAFLYYDTTLPLNAPIKITDQMTYLALSLFFLYEVRISLGREQQGMYGAFGFIGGMMATYSAIPSLLLYIIKGNVLSFSLSETILTLTTLAFIIGRMLVYDSSPENRPIPLMGEIIRVAEVRDLKRTALTESHEAAAATDAEPLAQAKEPDAQQAPIPEHEDETEDTQIAMDLCAPQEPLPIPSDLTDTDPDTLTSDTQETPL